MVEILNERNRQNPDVSVTSVTLTLQMTLGSSKMIGRKKIKEKISRERHNSMNR